MHNNSNMRNKQMVINTCKILPSIKISRTHACKMTPFSRLREFAPPNEKISFSRKWVRAWYTFWSGVGVGEWGVGVGVCVCVCVCGGGGGGGGGGDSNYQPRGLETSWDLKKIAYCRIPGSDVKKVPMVWYIVIGCDVVWGVNDIGLWQDVSPLSQRFGKWISAFITDVSGHVITYPCWGLK